MRALCLVAAIWLQVGYALAVGVDRQVLEDPAQEAYAQAVMTELRCLVCQNQSIVDSDAPLAADLRQIVRERIALGDDGAAVKAYLVARYGDWVLLNPPVKRSTFLLWATPVLALLLGAILAVVMRWRRPQEISDDEVQKADQLLRDGF